MKKKNVFANEYAAFLDKIYEAVSNCWNSVGSVSCKVKKTDTNYQIMFFPAVREVVGGANDGEQVFCGFDLNVGRFAKVFDDGPVVHFDCLRKEFIDHLRMRGKVDGNNVDIVFLTNPPPNQKAVERIYATGPRKGSIEAI